MKKTDHRITPEQVAQQDSPEEIGTMYAMKQLESEGYSWDGMKLTERKGTYSLVSWDDLQNAYDATGATAVISQYIDNLWDEIYAATGIKLWQ